MYSNLLPPAKITAYFRGRPLSGEDLRQYNQYLDHLRDYYNIPADQPVFPPLKRAPKTENDPGTPKTTKPSTGALNRADHPWRRP